MERFCTDSQILVGEKEEREEEGSGGIIWEFGNLSTTSIPRSAISMQMVAHVSDGESNEQSKFFSHITLNDVKLLPMLHT